ncbi:MAG: Bax inhibitor-1/YccA family protein [Candidatus Kapabacteria bacterium]|nr:Bax inhibitor-1/YccA family protein [Candidatus Kapabacteria bacterium]
MLDTQVQQVQSALAEAQRTYLARVYGWMVGGLAFTGVVAGWAVTSEAYWSIIIENSWLIWVGFGLQLLIVMGLSGAIHRMSSAVASGTFLLYAGLNGLTLATLGAIYTSESIATTFFICAATFGAMSVYGFTTKRDLTSMGSFFIMGVIGLIIASVVNIFLASSALHFAISVIGVLVFVGLTAYDTQKIKEEWEVEMMGTEIARKSSIIGALNLYLDFINLFLYLLRLFGDRR